MRLTRLLPVLLIVSSCAPPIYDDPIPVMLDREASFAARRQAADQSERRNPHNPRRLKALHKLLWQPRYPLWQRKYAIDQMLIHDADFKTQLKRRIVLVRPWKIRRYIFDLAVDRNWQDFTPALVRAYAQPTMGINDKDRPEKAAIEALNPDRPIKTVVFEIFANSNNRYDYREQVAAWALLNRICPVETLTDLLAQAPPSSSLVIDLKATEANLHILPRNRETVLWMAYLRDPARQHFWDAAKATIAQLNDERHVGLELRHLPVLLKVNHITLGLSRSELVRQIEAQLRSARHYYKGPTYDAPMSEHPQHFSHWRQRLGWADLVTIRLCLHLMEDRALVAELFRQADSDQVDTSTEYGGVIDIVAYRAAAHPYEPMVRIHQWKYVPSQTMIQHLYTAIAHYHFHAQNYHNREHSGPGRGDMQMAKNLSPNCLVFTFITPNQLNVDYYQHGGVVVDLGTIDREARHSPAAIDDRRLIDRPFMPISLF